jgi:hypothetical protein
MRAFVAVLLALAGAVCAVIALDAPVTSTYRPEPGLVVRWTVFLAGAAGGVYLALAGHSWRARFTVFGLATLAFGAAFFFTTDWHARADGRVEDCLLRAPAGRWPDPTRAIKTQHVSLQRIPPGLRCDFGSGSYVVRPDATDWLILLGESSAGGFAATGPLLFLVGRATRRRLVPRRTHAA